MAHDFVVPGHARRRRPAVHRDAAGHRHRRHDGRALAAVLPAELRHRQADHPAVHEVREGRPVDRHRHRGASAPPRSWASPRPRSRAPRGRQLHRRRRARRGARRPTAGTWSASCSRSRCSTPRSSAPSPSRCPPRTRIGDVFGLNHSLHRGVKQAKGFYARLRRADRGRRDHRAHPRLAARPAHQGRAGAGRGAAAVRRACSCCCCATTRRCSGPWVNGRKTNLFTADGASACW